MDGEAEDASMKQPDCYTTVTMRLPSDMADEVKSLARADGRSVNNYINKMLPLWLNAEKAKLTKGEGAG